MNKLALASIGTTVVMLAACSDATTGTNKAPGNNSDLVTPPMAAVYSSTPAGFSELSTSFNSSDKKFAFSWRHGENGPDVP